MNESILTIIGAFLLTWLGYMLISRFVFRKAVKDSFLLKVLSIPFRPFIWLREKRLKFVTPFWARPYVWLSYHCSKIKGFHYVPKAILAFVSEHLVYLFTGEHALAGVVFLLSLTFMVIVNIPSIAGQEEPDPEVVHKASVWFLRLTILATFFVIVLKLFFWDSAKSYFEGSFWNLLEKIMSYINTAVYDSASWYFSLHFGVWIATFIVLAIYIATSYGRK